MRILICNDDGIYGQGLTVLEEIAHELSNDVWTVVPDREQSGASHSLTLTEPLRVRRAGERRFAVKGTPTDCIMLAVNELIEGKRPDIVLSGINRGGNLGDDVTYSGTIAAAMEGQMLKIPSIALSQCFRNGEKVRWEVARRHGPGLLKTLIGHGWPDETLININFPDTDPDAVSGVEVCHQGQRDVTDLIIDKRIDARGVPYYWIGFRRDIHVPEPDTDLGVVKRGAIAVTPLKLDLTRYEAMEALAETLASVPVVKEA